MAKRKNKGKSWGVFFITMGFIVFQLLNIFFSMAYSEAFYVAFTGKSTINTNVNFEGMPEPGSVALFFPLYTLMRTFGYKVCHWLGYHADAELDSTLVPPTPFEGGMAFVIPVFEKKTVRYQQKFNQRSRFFQIVFYLGFALYTWAICYFGMQISYFIFKQKPYMPGIIPFFVTAMALMGLEWSLTRLYYKKFPKLFKLDVLMIEHGQPVLGHFTANQKVQMKMKHH
ncbi:hypothetical protein [Weissella paramesenteroides]|jgi:hypothetical protein|uniref:hypothetical protein n=1 Tax=Weissella paramesenteroides TaxID=1249 RepID=UPI0020733C04|nr:hypothetical protein [Weissella paramesenteroides]MCM6765055.1 hypothetical protein [Weissella paramesenteroides]MCM6767836.1 hypothetical protein [Weissella paramesenteroides]MCM6768889.1 hypothetical protein [Weissella paramesenteroides]MCM6770994.1 hypothetical protein [Weissella paramesenteroides]MCM6780915.1 hypothetical protein [Weissella paramesenteroides]